MSDLIVYTYDQEDKATDVLKHVASLKQDNVQKALVGIEDAAVVIKNAKGRVKVRQTLESAVKGNNIARGGLWGVLIGFLFGGPLFGALLGMSISGLLGHNIDIGIDNEFINGISNDLAPGDSALFLLVNNTPTETIAEALKGFNGKLYHTSLSEEAEAALTKAGDHGPIKEAIEAQNADS
ncbi:MAG: DUF1269 domain-containing protein [Deinococcota bacterium]